MDILRRKMVTLSQRRSRRPQALILLLIGITLIIGVAVIYFAQWKGPGEGTNFLAKLAPENQGEKRIYDEVATSPRPRSILGSAIDAALLELGVAEADIHITRTERINGDTSRIVIRRYVDVPPTYPLAMCNLMISRAVESEKAEVIEAIEKKNSVSGTRVVNMKIAERGIETYQVILRGKQPTLISKLVIPRAKKEQKIALIIDDFGSSLSSTAEALLRLNRPLTISILPYLPSSKRTAKIAHREGKEVLLHLPMEAENYRQNTSKEVILSVMTPDRIQAEVHRALKHIPYAIGVNNHMGSKVTKEADVMRPVMNQLRKDNCFFIDSMTNRESIAWRVAKNVGVPTAINRIFIDDEVGVEHSRERIAELARIAAKDGFAIGIGHPHHSTLQAIQQMIPVLESKGYKFVFVSSLVK